MKEGSAPMAADESGVESVLLGREVGGDEGKNIERYAVDGGKRVPPFANGCQCGRCVPVELRNCIQGETAEEASKSFLNQSGMVLDSRRRIRHALQLLVESEDEL